MDIQQAASAYNATANITQNAPMQNAAPASDAPSFSELVTNALSNSVDQGQKAEDISKLAMMGKADINELAVAVSNAGIALDTVVAVRDKVISAYQQIMQMSI